MTPCTAAEPPSVCWNDGRILLGTVYNIFHSEYPSDQAFFDQVDRDLPAIKAANINLLLVFPMSQWDPQRKALRWERTDYLVRRIEALGMKFVPLMLKEEQCSHYFPIWMYDELPEVRQHHHRPGSLRNTREHVDFAHPGVFPVLEAYFNAVIGRYGSSPSLSFYNIWNEPHYNHQSEHVVLRFREWLQRKYGSLPELRRIWGEDYSDWSQVTPFLNDDWDSSMPYIDWILFRNELNGILLHELAAMLRKYDTAHAINANPVGTTWAGFGSFGAYNTDNWQFTPHQDFCGISYYPDAMKRTSTREATPVWQHNLTFNTVRSAAGDKNYILTELYTNGKSGLTLGGWLDHAAVRHLAWIALANDCKGLIYWKWEPFVRGRQSLGRGLCRLDGQLAARGEAVKELGAVLGQWGGTLLEARPEPPQVAILLDMIGLLKCLEHTPEPRLQTFMYESNAGFFRALDEANFTVDFLRADLGISPDRLAAFKVVILPFQIVMRPEVAALLKAWVRDGGCLIADARTATLDALDFAYACSPGAGLDEVFGARRLDWQADDVFHPVHWLAASISPEAPLEGRFYREQIEPYPGAECLAVFADDASPAAIRHVFGKGQACLFAFPVGATLHVQPSGPLARVFIDLLGGLGVEPRFHWTGDPGLMIRQHLHPRGKLLYLIGSPERAVAGVLALPGIGPDAELVSLAGTANPQPVSVDASGNRQLQVHLKERDVQVYWISRV